MNGHDQLFHVELCVQVCVMHVMCMCLSIKQFRTVAYLRCSLDAKFETHLSEIPVINGSVSTTVLYTTMFHVGVSRVSLFCFCYMWCMYLRLSVEIPRPLISKVLFYNISKYLKPTKSKYHSLYLTF